MSDVIQFFVEGIPAARQSVKRAERDKFGRKLRKPHFYQPDDRAAGWKERIRAEALKHKPAKLWNCPIILLVTFEMPTKDKKLYGQFHTKKPDCDNLLKPLKDALQGVIYTNDSRICEVNIIKRYIDPSLFGGETPGAWIELTRSREVAEKAAIERG